MDIKQYQAAMEAILFSSGEPVSVSRLSETLDLDTDTTVRLVEDYMQSVNIRAGGIVIIRLDDSYQMCSAKEYAEYVRKALDIRRNVPLSQAAMEVLAIIAYNQPVTRAFVEQVRGVDCSAVVQGLVAKKLIEEQGRMDLPGRPLLYGTTADFLRCFGVSGLGELPPLPQSGDGVEEPTLQEMVEGSAGETPEE